MIIVTTDTVTDTVTEVIQQLIISNIDCVIIFTILMDRTMCVVRVYGSIGYYLPVKAEWEYV